MKYWFAILSAIAMIAADYAADPIWFRIAALASVIFSLWAIQWEIRSK